MDSASSFNINKRLSCALKAQSSEEKEIKPGRPLQDLLVEEVVADVVEEAVAMSEKT